MYHTLAMRKLAFLSCLVGLTVLPAAAKEKPVAEALPPSVDISAVKDKLVILSDGKDHYVAVIPFSDVWQHLYYGNGKRFFLQRVTGGGSSGTESWDRVFWEPRVDARWKAGVGWKDGKYSVQCGDRETTFTSLANEARDKILASATFHEQLWQYQAYSLARDNQGHYYYVDRPLAPANSKTFRLFSGLRGSLKPLKMTNIVSDSQGDIFTTRSGELRLVLDKQRSVWVERKKELELIQLPIQDNHVLIYQDLGVYEGQRLGTPCDDLL